MIRLGKIILGFSVIAGVIYALLYLPIMFGKKYGGNDGVEMFMGVLILELFAILMISYMSDFAFSVGDDIIRKIKNFFFKDL